MREENRHKINFTYMLKSYFIGIVWGSVIFIPTLLANVDDSSSVVFATILSVILFPFAKLVYDVVIGFKLEDKVKNTFMSSNYFLDRLLFLSNLFILILSILLAPFGILYLIGKGILKVIKKQQ